MELFNRFRKTVFLKEDSDLEKQLDELKSLRNKVNNTDEIDKDIKLLEYGIQGEKDIAFELRNANIGMYVLHDVTFEYDGNKSQIDYLIFSRGYFYVIECKNLIGNITVDRNGQFYREYEYNSKMVKESMYSPYTQATRHKDILKKIWSSYHNKFDNLVFGSKLGKDWFRPVVVLTNTKGILNIKDAPKEIKDDIIRVDQLISYIQKDIDNYDRDLLYKEKELKKAAEVWLSRSVVNNTNIASKYQKRIEQKTNDLELEKALKEFRRKKSKKMNVPAYYIFTDEEMENLINSMPKTIEELRKVKILSEIKIKCHGEEIINILNKKY